MTIVNLITNVDLYIVLKIHVHKTTKPDSTCLVTLKLRGTEMQKLCLQ